MKRLIVILTAVLFTATVWGQSPEAMSYQAVIRNNLDELVANQSIGMQISILQGSATGTAVFVETHAPTTNANGLVTVEIGNGTMVSGDFSDIDWSNGPYFIKTEVDLNGGANYTITGVSQLLSVPYALHAKTVDNLSGINTGDQTLEEVLTQGNDAGGTNITNLGDPVNAQDAATKAYVDLHEFSGNYNDLTNTPSIKDTVNAVLDTVSKFVKLPNNVNAGDILFYDGTTFIQLPIGNERQVLTVYNGLPKWRDIEEITNDSINVVRLDKADEDYIDFGTFQNFTNQSDWCIIEKIKIPSGGLPNNGWHSFRGSAWQDKEGDIAIQLRSDQLHAWVRKSGWRNISYNATFNEEQWYTICLQYNSSTQVLELYLDGNLVAQTGNIAPQDDSVNTNKLFFGGQEVSAGYGQGDLYAEASVIIAHQAWLQRNLTPQEISDYDGYIAPEPSLFFATQITSNSVQDYSGNNRHGTNGNSPVYYKDVP